MNTKVKSTLIILSVLLIGAAIGFELSELSVRNRFHRIDEFRERHGFVNMFKDIIKPDNNQLTSVDSILVNYHNHMDSLAKSSMQQVSVQMDSMKADLDKVLNQEQKDHLKKEIDILMKEVSG